MRQQIINFVLIFILGISSYAQNNVSLSSNGAVATSNAIPLTKKTSTFSASNTIDNLGTRWIVYYNENQFPDVLPMIYLEIDLGASYTINSFKTIEENNNIKDYSFKTWSGTSWDVAISESQVNSHENLEANFGKITYTINRTFNPVTTSKVRLEITAHHSVISFKLYELLVFEANTASVEKFSNNSFSIYPNPVSGDTLKVNFNELITSVEVYAITGEQVKCQHSNNEINVKNLKPGIYFVKLNNLKTIKIIRK